MILEMLLCRHTLIVRDQAQEDTQGDLPCRQARDGRYDALDNGILSNKAISGIGDGRRETRILDILYGGHDSLIVFDVALAVLSCVMWCTMYVGK